MRVGSVRYGSSTHKTARLLGAHRMPCARRANIWSSPRVMASADLSSLRGRTQYPYALREPWPQSGPTPVSSARMHTNIGCRAASRENTPPLLNNSDPRHRQRLAETITHFSVPGDCTEKCLVPAAYQTRHINSKLFTCVSCVQDIAR